MKGRIQKFLLRYGVLVAAGLLCVFFAAQEPRFATLNNILNLLREMAILGLFALALTITVITGGFDLSFASGATMAGIVGLVLIREFGFSIYSAFLIVFLINMVLASVKGLLVVQFGMPSFIATLGVSTLCMGVSRLLTGGTTYFAAQWPKGFEFLGRGQIGPVPVQVIVLLLLGLLSVVIMDRTRFGRYAYAVGGNAVAARHVGIRTERVRFSAWLLSGVLCGIAAVVLISMLGAGSPEMGEGYTMPAIAAMFLGCVAYREGVPNIWGVLTATAVLAILSNGFVMMGLRFYWKDVMQGLVLIAAVGVVSVIKRGKLYEIMAGF